MSLPQLPAIPSPSRARRWRKRVAGGAAACVALYSAVIVGAAHLSLHPPRTAVAATPTSLHLKFEEVRFPSATDGLNLRGWYIPADGTPKGLILFCHGRQGNRAGVLTHARYLHQAGFALFSFDFRACGDSDGDMSTIGWREVGDAQGAVSYIASRVDTKNVPLGIFGASMGAAVAIQLAAKTPEIRCVVADSPYATLDRAVDQRFRGLFPSGSSALSIPIQFAGEQMMGHSAITVSPLDAIPKIAPRPLFLIHGLADQLIRSEDSQMLFDAAKGPKQLWLVPGARHVGAYKVAKREYQQRVTRFFQSNLHQ